LKIIDNYQYRMKQSYFCESTIIFIYRFITDYRFIFLKISVADRTKFSRWNTFCYFFRYTKSLENL